MSSLHSFAETLGRALLLAKARAEPFAAEIFRRLRHPTRRGLAITLGAGPAMLLLYTLVLVPFTPSISDIRKVTAERPARVSISRS